VLPQFVAGLPLWSYKPICNKKQIMAFLICAHLNTTLCAVGLQLFLVRFWAKQKLSLSLLEI
jgi:hypothetical protein